MQHEWRVVWPQDKGCVVCTGVVATFEGRPQCRPRCGLCGAGLGYAWRSIDSIDESGVVTERSPCGANQIHRRTAKAQIA